MIQSNKLARDAAAAGEAKVQEVLASLGNPKTVMIDIESIRQKAVRDYYEANSPNKNNTNKKLRDLL